MENSRWTLGFVYVLTNPSTPSQVKVGYTKLLAEDRAQDLYRGNTSVSDPFEVAYVAMVSHPAAVEREAHHGLAEYRVNPRREFFRVSVDVAVEAVRHAMIEASGIASWKAPQRHRLQSGDRLALTLEAGQVFAVISYPDALGLFSQHPKVIDLWQAHSHGDVLEIFVSSSARHVAGFATDDPGALSDPLPHLDRSKRIANGMLNGRERLVPGDRLLWLPSPNQAQAAVMFEVGDYTQVLSRTWSLRRDANGTPLIFNIPTHDDIWPEAESAIRDALKLPIPRQWAPRENRGDDWVPIGLNQQPPEHWLPQLNARRKSRK